MKIFCALWDRLNFAQLLSTKITAFVGRSPGFSVDLKQQQVFDNGCPVFTGGSSLMSVSLLIWSNWICLFFFLCCLCSVCIYMTLVLRWNIHPNPTSQFAVTWNGTSHPDHPQRSFSNLQKMNKRNNQLQLSSIEVRVLWRVYGCLLRRQVEAMTSLLWTLEPWWLVWGLLIVLLHARTVLLSALTIYASWPSSGLVLQVRA